MTLNITQLRERVSSQFSNVEQVGDSVIRFTRKAGDLPFAVYYLDVAADLPGTQEKLTRYQDRIIGGHFFQGLKSLQWSNYLYFITSGEKLGSSEVRKAKELIERDRSYARKFVISEEDLETVLAPHVVAPAQAVPRINVLSVWIDRLAESGLDAAILGNDDLPTRLALIESSSAKRSKKPIVPRRAPRVQAAPFIRSLELKKFRDFPRRRTFEFGTVNLIFGANGSGKTSLLEAIELFYCGRNKRNSAATPAYELNATLADGRTEKATNSRGLQEFRNRNLTWYGQPEIKTNNLYMSFAQFNFLDTDAAVGLADSTARIEDDLSKLLVGPDASKTWDNIQRVGEAVSSELRGVRVREAEAQEELVTLEKRLKEAGSIRQESDSVRVRLEEMIRRLGWVPVQGDKEALAGKVVGALSELVTLARQATAFDWTEPPVSINGLAKYCREAKVKGEKAETHISRLELLRKKQKDLEDRIKRDREALGLTEQLKQLIDAGIPERVAEQTKQQNAVAAYAGQLAGLDADALGLLSTAQEEKLTTCHEAAISTRLAAETSLKAAKDEYGNFSKLRDQSLNLAQQLRQVAARILENSSKPDECPLCHTRFEPGELAKHIDLGVDVHLEAIGQTVLGQLHEREEAVRRASAVEAVTGWLTKFCERAGLSTKLPVGLLLANAEGAKRGLAESRGRLEKLKSETFTLESRGFSISRLEQISGRLQELRHPLGEVSRQAVDRLTATVDKSLASSSQALETERKEADQAQKTVEASLGSMASGIQDFKSALSQLKERLAGTDRLRVKLADFSSSFPWPGEKPLAELAVEAESVSKVAAELQAALGREKQARAAQEGSLKRKELVQERLSHLRARISRFSEAQAAFEILEREHSLNKAMESAVQQNRADIEEIFSRIHSPAEFRGLGSSWATLVRKRGETEVKLSEISSGQRSAFALSLFLAQNAQLKVGPPVVLMDDPIAHVDDLNSLSFLDYLREVALTGQRQIYFATANDKVATLFERKFDFLGSDGFRRFDLLRETRSAALSA